MPENVDSRNSSTRRRTTVHAPDRSSPGDGEKRRREAPTRLLPRFSAKEAAAAAELLAMFVRGERKPERESREKGTGGRGGNTSGRCRHTESRPDKSSGIRPRPKLHRYVKKMIALVEKGERVVFDFPGLPRFGLVPPSDLGVVEKLDAALRPGRRRKKYAAISIEEFEKGLEAWLARKERTGSERTDTRRRRTTTREPER
jgi:hypothetical protein